MESEPVILGILFSDLVIRENGTGKISMIGCFNQYMSNGFPFVVPPFFVTAILTNIKGKTNNAFNITIRVEDSTNGHVLTSISGKAVPTGSQEMSGLEVLEFPCPMPQFAIPSPGKYMVEVLVDNDKVGSRPLMINSLTQNPPQLPPPQAQ